MTSILSELRLVVSAYDPPGVVVRKLAHRFLRAAWAALQLLGPRRGGPAVVHLVMPTDNDDDREEITRRYAFYARGIKDLTLNVRRSIPSAVMRSREAVMVFGPAQSFVQGLARHRPGTFDVDFRRNPLDGWAWTDLADYLDSERADLAASHRRFAKRIAELRREARACAYVFGTGPSLEKAAQRNWEDGYRIVCNSIVRDAALWHHIRPDFVVAGDAIYHFGFTSIARAFRKDLRDRLRESTALFVYPARFHAAVRHDLQDVADRLVPIPSGWRRRVDLDLNKSFRLPGLRNVLGLLLLPLACTLSNRVFLWGFDGRAPNDQLFWSNSPSQSYPEFMPELVAAHPRFFEQSVPDSDPSAYVRSVQGERFEASLRLAEMRGFQFETMHASWTPALQRRYHVGVGGD